jgi:hypothetical protein
MVFDKMVDHQLAVDKRLITGKFLIVISSFLQVRHAVFGFIFSSKYTNGQ